MNPSAIPSGGPITASAAATKFDWSQGLKGWRIESGHWAVEPLQGQQVLMQRGDKEAFNLIVAPSETYTDVDATVKFMPVSGREDASGGIVFRYQDGRYYVIRANALEDNFRLYTYDRSRRMVATARVTPPALGQWHTLRVTATGDRIQGYLNGQLLIDHKDSSFATGQVGLWTKADSTTAFAELTVRGTAQSK